MNRQQKNKHIIVVLVVAALIILVICALPKIVEHEDRRVALLTEHRESERQKRAEVLNALTSQDFSPEHWETFTHSEQIKIITLYGGDPDDL